VWFSQGLLLQLKIYIMNCVIQPGATATAKDPPNPQQPWLSCKWSSSSWVCHDTATCLEVLYVDSFLNIFSRLLKANTPAVATEIQNSLMGNWIQQRPTEEAKSRWHTVTEAKAYRSQMASTKQGKCLYHSQFLTASHKIWQDISIISLMWPYSQSILSTGR